MKKFYYIIIFCSSILWSQKSSSFLKVDYILQCNTDLPTTLNTIFIINTSTKESYYEEFLNVDRTDLKINSKSNGSNRNVIMKPRENSFSYFNSNDSIFTKEPILNKSYLVKEKAKIIKWDLSYTETRNIGKFIAKKATSYFRGRNYTAWYTLEIPVNRGPFKFHGLPGLILEISDDEGIYNWVATSITTEKILFPENLNFDNEDFITLEEFVDLKFNSGNEIEISSRLPRGIEIQESTNNKKRYGIEIKFEWEEEEVDGEKESN